jgi:L-amino acid N-acyltransferase YncA
MSSAIYPLPGYPAVYHTQDGTQVTIRPMQPQDRNALLDFFRRVTPEDRLYLKDDVTSAEVINRWAETLDYRRVLPLLALVDDRIVGDGTLHHSRAKAMQHVGGVRVVIDPAYRNQGIGRTLLQKLIEVAKQEDRHLEKIVFEVVADTELAAQHAARALGFEQVGVYASHVRYYDGQPHDLIVMELQMSKAGTEAEMPDLSEYTF